MAFALELEAAGGVGDAFAAVVAAIEAGFGSAEDLADGLVGVDFLAVEVDGDEGFFAEFAVLESGGAEGDVVGVPSAGAVVSIEGGGGIIDHGGHAVGAEVAVEDLDFVAVLQIDAAVAAGLGDAEFDVEAEVAVFGFGDDVGGSVFSAVGGAVVGHDDGAFGGFHGVGDDFPFDGHGGEEAGAFPVFPFGVEQRAGAVDEDFCAGGWGGSEVEVFILG